jgi:hypothetical protein
MALCDVCNNLQVDATTNQQPDECSWPESERLQSLALDATLCEWRGSAERGCATCRLIWDALLHFHKGLASKFSGKTIDEDEAVDISVNGRLGQTLLVELYPHREGERYPGLEFYSSHSRYTTCLNVKCDEVVT